MAISIDWGTRVISVPQADLTFISGSLYELDTDVFRLTLKCLEDDEDGMPYPNTHIHNTAVTVAGITYARTIEIINGYSVYFEDTGLHYTVKFVGSNNNIWDEEAGILISTPNMSYIPTNSAGLIVTTIESVDAALIRKILDNALDTDPTTGKMVLYDDDGVTPIREWDIYEDIAKTQPYRSQGTERRDPPTVP